MSSAPPDSASTQAPAKPGTACLGCRRRKLKCSREQGGCANCTKADLPCVYPTPDTGVKRKRGPYKKDKPARERHLEHLVQYLEPRSPGALAGSANTGAVGDGMSRSHQSYPQDQAASSESLVKDALIALTRTSVSEREPATDGNGTGGEGTANVAQTTSGDLHPPAARMFEYWSIFVARVDPLTKIIHCPSFVEKLGAAVNNLHALDAPTETLLFSIYYAAVDTCTPREARARFGESRDVLFQRYGRAIEDALANSYSMPALESVQALVIYIIGVRRRDDGTSVSALFGLAVRMAQLIGLDRDPGTKFKPLEAELRRRLWWHICGLESRTAEEGVARTTSITERSSVQLPANLNDVDLDPRGTKPPLPREGVTETTFVRLRWEVMHMVRRIWLAKKEKGFDGQTRSAEKVLAEQREIFEQTRSRLDRDYSQHMHKTRPFDWMCLCFLEGMLTKTKLLIDSPLGPVPRKDMSHEERMHLLQSSVTVISLTHMIAVESCVEQWHWFFRDYVQWHSLAIVVAELGRSTNKQFTTVAWAVLDPILADWDRLYGMKKDEPAWHHVNMLISRAKQKRYQCESGISVENSPVQASDNHHSRISEHPYPDVGFNRTHQSLAGVQDANATGQQWTQPPGSTIPHQQQQFHSSDTSSAAQPQACGCAPTAWDFGAGLGSFDGLDQIDFRAFDAVFGGTGWEFPSQGADFSMMGTPHETGLQAPGCRKDQHSLRRQPAVPASL